MKPKQRMRRSRDMGMPCKVEKNIWDKAAQGAHNKDAPSVYAMYWNGPVGLKLVQLA